MKQILTLTTYEQLKALSDPLRAEMIMRLLEKPYTGQQLSVHFNLSRAKIHYHLKELAKNGLIEIVKTEEKNGIIQKFYQATARGFVPSADLMPHAEAISETARQLFAQMAEKTKMSILSAPDTSFSKASSASDNPEDWDVLASTWEITATEADFKKFIQDFFSLMNRLSEKSKAAEQNGKLYHISAYGFEIDEQTFQGFEKEEESD